MVITVEDLPEIRSLINTIPEFFPAQLLTSSTQRRLGALQTERALCFNLTLIFVIFEKFFYNFPYGNQLSY